MLQNEKRLGQLRKNLSSTEVKLGARVNRQQNFSCQDFMSQVLFSHVYDKIGKKTACQFLYKICQGTLVVSCDCVAVIKETFQ